MPGLTRYPIDIFVSYAHADNEGASPDEMWVSRFVGDIRRSLTRRFGVSPAIYFDVRKLTTGTVVEELLEHARNSAIFLAVISPSYVKRNATRDELKAFCSSPDGSTRLCPVEILPLDSEEEYFKEFTAVKRASFWYIPGDSGTAVRVEAKFYPDKYYARIEDLAEHLRQRFRAVELKRSAPETQPPPVPPAPDRAKTVLVDFDIIAGAEVVVPPLATAARKKGSPPLVSGRKPRRYVSYAWADKGDPSREKEVDRLCDAALARGDRIIRDKTAMRRGDRISDFMREIGRGDRVYVFLSDKYLKSPFCMFELFEVWRNSRQEAADLNRRVRLYVLDDAKIWKPIDRLHHAQYWDGEYAALNAALAGKSPTLLGEADFKRFRHMRDFAHHVADILALFADTVQPRTFDDFLTYGFDDPPGKGA